jgi:hypothetical protein
MPSLAAMRQRRLRCLQGGVRGEQLHRVGSGLLLS